MEPKDMTGLRDNVKYLKHMADIFDENNMCRTASECRLAAKECSAYADDIDALRKENEELKEKIYFFARTFRYYAGEAFRFYEKHPLARETDETRSANTTKESEASHDRSGEATND